jgi:hypothetical protein
LRFEFPHSNPRFPVVIASSQGSAFCSYYLS